MSVILASQLREEGFILTSFSVVEKEKEEGVTVKLLDRFLEYRLKTN
jgi:hypothetical protein